MTTEKKVTIVTGASNSTLLRFQQLFSLPPGVAVRCGLPLFMPPHEI